MGLLLIAAADKLSFRGAPWAVPLFWAGLVVIVGSAAAVLWSQDTSRRDAIAVVLIVGLALYAAKILHSPTGLGNYDELLHYRSLDDLVRSGRMFSENTLLPISPFYPGLEVLTSTLMKVTGLGIFSAAVVIIGIA